MTSVTVSQVLRAFWKAFQSIDLRIVAVDDGTQVTNMITSIFASTKSPDEVELEQKKLSETLPDSGGLLVILRSLYFKEIFQIIKDLRKGRLRKHMINYQELDLSKLTVGEFHKGFLREFKEWKVIGAKADRLTDELIADKWNIIENSNDHARLHGFEDIYDLINYALGIKGWKRGNIITLVIGIPIPARIAESSLEGTLFKTKVKKVCSLDDLQLNLFLKRLDARGYYEPFWRKTELLKTSSNSSENECFAIPKSFQLEGFRPYDMVEVELIHRKVPTLCLDKDKLKVPLKRAVEPFAQVLFNFSTIKEYKKRLLNPEKVRKPDMVFENAVAWLLSLIGYSVIKLGKEFEKLKVPETKYEIGSTDMIAYRENDYLLLVECDTSIPDDKKIQSMKSIKEHFESIQDRLGEPRILSIIVSPRDCEGITTDPMKVRIVNKNRIEDILKAALKGDTRQARNLLIY